MTIINLTGHPFIFKGKTVPPSGPAARVRFERTVSGFDFFRAAGEVVGVPEAERCPLCGSFEFHVGEDMDYCGRCGHDIPDRPVYVVPEVVAKAAARPDVVSLATEHPDCVRDGTGTVSVPGFVTWD